MQTNSNSEIQIIEKSYNLIEVHKGIIHIKFECSNNLEKGQKNTCLCLFAQLEETLLNTGSWEVSLLEEFKNIFVEKIKIVKLASRLAQLAACPRQQIVSKFGPQSAYFATFAIKMQ